MPIRRSRSSLSEPSPLSTHVALTRITFGADGPFSRETLWLVPGLSSLTTVLVILTGFEGDVGATAGADGAVVTKLTAMPRGTVAATALDLFIVKAGAPTVYLPIDSELMAAYTSATTTATPETTFGNISLDTPLRLEAGDKLYVGTEVALAAGIVFYAEWMDF